MEITIDLSSVNTLIPIRNERMQNLLFEIGAFPSAAINAAVDISGVAAMTVGESSTSQINFTLDMHGVSRSYNADVLITKTGEGVVASTLKPIIVTAEAHDLVTGVEALREVAGLPRISLAVPVSFTVVFSQ